MAALVNQVSVFNEAQMESTVNSYIAQGYAVANRTLQSVTMIKRKEFNVVWAIVGFFLCLLPLLIYSIVYATQSDMMVEIRVVNALPQLAGIQMSPDARWWWDGSRWQDAETAVPPGSPRSPDGHYWWDGARWRPLPSVALSPAAAPPDDRAGEPPPR
ncbi:MAG TPA: hypothetical protein VN193_06230 [Candidatus Angelobacter sp.]|nr:hypothetical protein [Candidatus Angelobacter sp.]